MKAIITIGFPKDKVYDPTAFEGREVDADAETLGGVVKAMLDMGAIRILIERKEDD